MKIAITQRSDLIADCKENRDSLDQNWSRMFRDDILYPIPNLTHNFEEWAKIFGFDLIILTGGNDINYSKKSSNVCIERDEIEGQILKFSKENNVPILGVCRGFQMINYYEGGRMSYNQDIPIEPHLVFLNELCGSPNKKIYVNSYHKWYIPLDFLADKFEPLAIDYEGNIEAAKHKILPWLGLMWHPERNDFNNLEFDFLLKEFIEAVKCK
tara:strand:- start:790 stop:1425 length:636 start_codon:yes stop_codon:yes gene_type:complete